MSLTDVATLLGIGGSLVIIANYFFSNSFDKRFKDSIQSFNDELKGLSKVVSKLDRTLDKLNLSFNNLEEKVGEHSTQIERNTNELQDLKHKVELYHHRKCDNDD